MFTSEALPVETKEILEESIHKNFGFWDLLWDLLKSPHLNFVCLIRQTAGILHKAGMPYLCFLCFHGNNSPLFSLFIALSIDILSGSEHFSLREILPVSKKLISLGFVKINCRCQAAQNFHESGLCCCVGKNQPTQTIQAANTALSR